MKFRTGFGDRVRTPADVGGPSLTKQSFAAECDANVIMARFEKTGIPPVMKEQREPQYIDVSAIPDFAEAHRLVQVAQDTFAALPASVRARFSNDPVAFMDFLNDKSNYDEALKLGIVEPRKDPDADAKAARDARIAEGVEIARAVAQASKS